MNDNDLITRREVELVLLAGFTTVQDANIAGMRGKNGTRGKCGCEKEREGEHRMYVRLHELKRCPFCGELAKVIQLPFCPEDIKSRKWVVGCDGKHGSLCPGYIDKCAPFYLTRELAVEHWNNRPPIAVADEI